MLGGVLDSYNKMSHNYSLNDEQKRHYLHNLLSKDALRFYLNQVDPYAATLQIAADMIAVQNNSTVHQTQVIDYLNGLIIAKYVSTVMDETVVLAKIYAEVVRMSSQFPMSHKGHEYRVRLMRRAVSSRTWSHLAVQRVASQGSSFQQLYGELESALQLHPEGTATSNRSADESFKQDETFGFVRLGRYKRRRFANSAGGVRAHGGRNPLDIAGCFNCDSKTHMARDCPSPLNLPRAAKRKLEFLRRKKARFPV